MVSMNHVLIVLFIENAFNKSYRLPVLSCVDGDVDSVCRRILEPISTTDVGEV